MDQPDVISDAASSKSMQSKINFFKTLEEQPQAQEAKTIKSSKGAYKAKLTNRESPRMATRKPKKESFWSLPIFESPVCFISTEEDGKLHLHEDILDQMEQIEAPLVVIGIAGLYRTGKSYLMNCLAGQRKGFALGNTIESKTKGIWAWCKQHPRQEDTVLLLLDTEGLGDVDKGDIQHDNKIFTVTTLLSNVLVYNMMSVFNHDVVEKLTFITTMSQKIRFKNKQCASDRGQEEIGLVLPTLVLCLRDFTLDLVKGGKEMTADEYLEDCLQIKSGRGSDVESFNKPRECIRTYFHERKCFTFDTPGDRTVMKRLETTPANALSKSFREDTDAFLDYMYNCETKTLLSSKPLRGKMFATLASAYVNDIRAGAVPNVDDAINVCANIENERIADVAIRYFSNELESIVLPILKVDDIDENFKTLQKKALDFFRGEAVFGADKFEIRVTEEMDKMWRKVKVKNDPLVHAHCQMELQKAYDVWVGKRMGLDKYEVSGGHADYRNDMLKMKKEYTSNTEGIDQYIVQTVFNGFIKEESNNDYNILIADQKLSQEDKHKEIERLTKENQDAPSKQQKLYEQQLKEGKKRAVENMQKLEKEREEHRKEEEQKLKEVIEQWKSQQIINEKQIQMMKTENENIRKEMMAEIKRLMENKEVEKLKKDKKKLEEKLEKMENRGFFSRLFNW